MANDSLYDLSPFLNRWFWRIELPFEKSALLHIFYAVRGCLYAFPQVRLNRRVRLLPFIGGKESVANQHGRSLVHAPVRHATRIPRFVLIGEVVL